MLKYRRTACSSIATPEFIPGSSCCLATPLAPTHPIPFPPHHHAPQQEGDRERAREASRPFSLRPAPPASPSTTKVRMEWTPAERHVESHVERPAEHVPVKTHIHDGLTIRPIRGSPTVDHQSHTIALFCHVPQTRAPQLPTLLALSSLKRESPPSPPPPPTQVPRLRAAGPVRLCP
jgi:hypothetical protein